MNGTENFKITNAQKAMLINNYKKTKYKQLKANAAIWFNKKKLFFCASNMGFSLMMSYMYC